jgi:hypothetical protein
MRDYSSLYRNEEETGIKLSDKRSDSGPHMLATINEVTSILFYPMDALLYYKVKI